MKIGIMTFHASHNHGSMLQAYATQRCVEKTGNECEIINFRMQSQKDYYALYQTKYGAMRLVRGLTLLPLHAARVARAQKFEHFLKTRYLLSPREMATYDDLVEVADTYDVYLSGSDQIWCDSIPEFCGSDVDYTDAYFLSFAAPEKPRVAFGTSTGTAGYEALLEKRPLLERYSSIAVREEEGAKLLCRILGREVECVIDPTLMLSVDEWRELGGEEPLVEGDYILLYSLRGLRPARRWGMQLSALGKRLGMRVVCVSPFYPVLTDGVHNYVNVGPEDFLNLVDHATLVFTDTFHGTAFSVNFDKSFYSLTPKGSGDNRKLNVLRMAGLEDRAIRDIGEVATIGDWRLPDERRSEAQAWLAAERERCMSVLRCELEDAADRRL